MSAVAKPSQKESPLVGVLVGSKSDLPVAQGCLELLRQFGIPHQVAVVSAHRTPDLVESTLSELEPTVLAYIVFAGMAAHLAGAVASQTEKPVIGVPVSASLNGLDALLSVAQMPPGVPVAAMAVDGAKNAALFAASVLALTTAGEKLQLARKLAGYRVAQAEAVAEANRELNT